MDEGIPEFKNGVDHLPLLGGDQTIRITSYNVCYTKLLRRPSVV